MRGRWGALLVAVGLSAAHGPDGRVVVVAEEDATAVGVAVAVAGSGVEVVAENGLTLLAVEAVVEQARAELSALGAEAWVECGRWVHVVRLVAPPGTWRAAAGVLATSLSRPVLSGAAVERARTGLATSLDLDRANPAWQARLGAARSLYAPAGEDSPWSRPACGVPEALALYDSSRVRLAAASLGPAAGAAIVGAVDAGAAEGAAAVLAPLFEGRARLPVPPRPVPGRVYVERNTITAWVAASWPFGAEVDPDAARVVGAVLEAELGPAVSRPEVLHAASEVEAHGHGGALVVTLVVRPEHAAEAAALLVSGAERLAAGGVHETVLDRVTRRSRGVLLRELAEPEARAARLARAAARGAPAGAEGAPGSGGGAGPAAGWPASASLTAGAVREAARGLGPASLAVVGPRPARGAVVP